MELIIQDVQHSLNVSSNVFNCRFNEPLVHQVITAYSTSARQGTKSQKSRSEVTGSNKKPWRQKGTGRARAGSLKSPIWRSGGVTFATKPHKYKQKINKKMYRGALKSIFSELIRQKRLIIVEAFVLEKPKTKLLIQKIKNMMLDEVLILVKKIDNNLLLAARNLYKVDVLETNSINPINLIKFNKVLITVDALKQIEGNIL